MTWLRNNWLNLVVGVVILAIIGFGLSSLRGCGASVTTNSGPSPLFFIIFSVIMILIGSKNRDQRYFGAPLLYFGVSLFVVASIGGLGTISRVFSKNPNYSTLLILGLVVVAGIFAYNKTGDKTGDGFLLKKTIGAITAGLALFLVGLVIVKFSGIDFDAKSFSVPKITLPNFPENINPMFLLFGTTILFATIWWKRKGKLVGLITLILFFLLLGQGFFDLLSSRWPSQIPTPKSIGQGIGDAGKNLGGYIPRPSGQRSTPTPQQWVKFAEVDFNKVSLGGALKNPVECLRLPRGTYLFSPTVQAKFGRGDWYVQTQLTLTREEVVSLRPPGGDITKTVTIYKKE